MLQAGFKPAENLKSDFVEGTCVVVTTSATRLKNFYGDCKLLNFPRSYVFSFCATRETHCLLVYFQFFLYYSFITFLNYERVSATLFKSTSHSYLLFCIFNETLLGKRTALGNIFDFLKRFRSNSV